MDGGCVEQVYFPATNNKVDPFYLIWADRGQRPITGTQERG